MKKCYNCDVSEERAMLYEGVAKEGFVSVCRKCYLKNEIPLIEKKKLENGSEKRMSVRERLMKISGVKRKPMPELSLDKPKSKEENLDKIVEENFKKTISKEPVVYGDLVPNFHWIVMRKRRMKKISREELAKNIFEPVVAIESLEKGSLPKDYLGFIKKIESALDVSLLKINKPFFDPEKLAEESKISTGLTISDLKEIFDKEVAKKPRLKKKDLTEEEIDPEDIDINKIQEIVGVPIEEVPEPEIEEDEEDLDEEDEDDEDDEEDWEEQERRSYGDDFSQEDINDILFRR